MSKQNKRNGGKKGSPSDSHKKGDPNKRILYLVDTLINDENLSMALRLEKANELHNVLTTSKANSLRKTVQILLFGGNGLEPLFVLFSHQMSTDSLKDVISQCLVHIGRSYPLTPNSSFSHGTEEFIFICISRLDSHTHSHSNSEQWIWDVIIQVYLITNASQWILRTSNLTSLHAR